MRKSDKKMIWSMFSFIVNLLWDIRNELNRGLDNINHYSQKEYDRFEEKSREWIEEE